MTDGAERSAKLLKAVVQRVTLHAGEAEVIFQPPFGSLAEAGTLLIDEAPMLEDITSEVVN